MLIDNPTVGTALGKITFWKRETSRGVYIDPYDSANTVFLNAPLIPTQPLRKVDSRQQRNTFSKIERITNRYGAGEASIDVPIKPSGSLGTSPHGYQVLEGWWGKEVVDPGVSVSYLPLSPTEGLHPSYTVLVKYGHKVYLLVGVIVKTASIEGVADDSQGVLGDLKGTINFLRRYYVGKDEISGSEAVGQTVLSVKNAKRFFYGYDSTTGVAMKVAFRTAGGTVEDNAGAGYTLAGVDVDNDTITISPALATTSLAEGDAVYGFVPDPSDVGYPVNFYLGQKLHGAAGDEAWTIVRANVTIDNNHLKILDFEANGLAYPNRIVDAGGNDNLRNMMIEIEFVQSEDDTALEYDAEQRIAHTLILPWGNVAAERFTIIGSQVELEGITESGDQEVHETVGHQALGTSPDGNDEGYMIFD